MDRVNRHLLVRAIALVVFPLVVEIAVAAIFSLLTFSRSDFVWKAAILLASYCLVFPPLLAVHAVNRFSGSTATRFDAVVVILVTLLSVPLFVTTFCSSARLISGIAVSGLYVRLIYCITIICIIAGATPAIRLTKRSSRP